MNMFDSFLVHVYDAISASQLWCNIQAARHRRRNHRPGRPPPSLTLAARPARLSLSPSFCI